MSSAEAKLWLEMVWPFGFNCSATKVQATMQAAVSTELSSSSLSLDVVVGALVYKVTLLDRSMYTHIIFNATAKGPAGGMGVAVADVQMLAQFTRTVASNCCTALLRLPDQQT